MRAQAKWVRMSARKARVVAEHIRGRSVPEARAVLAFTQRAAAREIEKVLASAVANAEANHGLVGDELVVHAAFVDEGPTLKRWRARARGRVARIRKRTCHITCRYWRRWRRGRQTAARAEAEAPSRSRPRRSRREADAGDPRARLRSRSRWRSRRRDDEAEPSQQPSPKPRAPQEDRGRRS